MSSVSVSVSVVMLITRLELQVCREGAASGEELGHNTSTELTHNFQNTRSTKALLAKAESLYNTCNFEHSLVLFTRKD